MPKKDPNAPRNPRTALQYFSLERREGIKGQHAGVSSAELVKYLAEEWRDLSAVARQPYIQSSSDDKARFLAESVNYVPEAAFLKATKGGNRLQKDPLRPKKPSSAYLYFGEAQRPLVQASNPGMQINSLSKIIGEQWAKLTAEERVPFDAKANEDKVRYAEEMKQYAPSEEYLAARAAFKAAKKTDGAPSVTATAFVVSGEPGEDGVIASVVDGVVGSVELASENKTLKRSLEDAEKTIVKQQKTIEQLQERAAKKVEKEAEKAEKQKEKQEEKAAEKLEKAAAKAEKAAQALAKPAVARAPKPPAAQPDVETNEAHYIKWVQSTLGDNMNKAPKELIELFANKGEAALTRKLTQMYKTEFCK